MNNNGLVINPSLGINTEDLTISNKKTLYLFIKRLFDIAISLVGLLFLIPIVLVVKIVTLCTGDTKSIFYSQYRIGKNGKLFKMYKFRSMVCNADEVLKDLLKDAKYKEEWDKNQKFEKDPRITKIGRILRKTSIDELPQLLNVLCGDLSLIGPRPLVQGEIESHNGDSKLYNSIKPGITGYWAVCSNSKTIYKERLEMEYFYIKNFGFKLDMKVFLKTFKAMFTGHGAGL